MKLTVSCSRLYKRGTRNFPYMEHYKYDYPREPVLKDKVSGKGEKEPRAVCVEEMSLMLNCLKSNDFDEKPCTQFIETFKNCVQVAETRRLKSKEMRKSGLFEAPTDEGVSRRLPAAQVTKLLRMFPEPK
ncbi:Coiled-coil-helix-coiled-coil-helix domain-containing protein 1 [Fasciolopsis buskii]|uniref:Coiled-coil-helix-coiled-coil-helix domain-containing protein 1 n=1 Tax=Fasciolopsis buskii TaxID=27845 RepID=A0A8E0VH39_9TREM|nr:Coiled-coil-helix-coiled-coil-helix domain-containing protein 1 [Fasciolopsis buski]